jgi:hypothetical protein
LPQIGVDLAIIEALEIEAGIEVTHQRETLPPAA